MKREQPGLADYGLLALLAMIWGGSFLLQKVAVAEVPPVTLTAVRQFLGAAIFAVILFWSRTHIQATWREHGLMFLCAIFGNALPFSLISSGLQVIDSGLAAILMGVMPLVTIVLAHFVTDDEKLNINKLMAVGMGIAGLVILFWPALVQGVTDNLFSQMIVFCAAICYAINSLLTKRLIHLDVSMLMGIIVAWSAVILLPAALVLETPPQQVPGAAASVSILLLAALPTVAASFLMYVLISRQGAGFFGQINLLVPLAGVFWGTLILSEKLPWNAWLALSVILGGIAVSRNWNATRKAANSQQQTTGTK
ncbi:DMT family transporter [Salaquimonas pukyongi]|uniref:DMT family transporter n=1 Tax=Salaquimonas pukyongi TaxID=2712698 RepID=UPI00096B780C|nr:DMT family transporter [Salaquimonas pukyongi]